MAKREITGQHLVLVALVIAALVLINTYVGPHWFGWGASAPVVVTGSEDVVKAISGVERNLSAEIGAVNETANAALAEAKKANQTASSSKPVLVTQTGTTSTVAVASATNTMDDIALAKANNLLAQANRITADAERFKKDARNLDDDEEDDASDLKTDVDDADEDRKDLKEEIVDLQDVIYGEYPNQPRNNTAQNMAGQVLDTALTQLDSAKEDIKDALADVNDILENDEEKSSVVYVTTPAGQTTTSTGVAGYQSQTEGL